MLLRAYLGVTISFRGDLRPARVLFENVLAAGASIAEVGREGRPSVAAEAIAYAAPYFSLTAWHLGDLALARRLMEQAEEWSAIIGGSAPVVAILMLTVLEGRRSDADATLKAADRLIALASGTGMAMMAGFGKIYRAWAFGRMHDATVGALELRQALDHLNGTGVMVASTYYHGLIADLEAAAGNTTAALEEIDKGLSISAKNGEHWADACLHCLRGDVLLKQEPARTTAARESYETAIAVANGQGARSLTLLASLPLAKLHLSANRRGEARDVLAPALEGFSPTPEMPQIAEAQTLLQRLP
ncbi:MAG: hypothetical protein JOY66_05675 [Acetobacteraceae bacterium]|nr:hypothetical protein [Acetobacteraceae bacterium]